jgi:hypothetical protein
MTPVSDPPPADGPAAAPETQGLHEQWQALVAEARPLVESLVALLKARGELLCFLAAERTRLFLGRQFAWLMAFFLFLASWVFLSVFLWRLSVAFTNQAWVGPLVLAVTHLLAGWFVLSWRERFRL